MTHRRRNMWFLAVAMAVGIASDIGVRAADANIRDADYARGYFGEAVEGMPDAQRARALHGYQLFIKTWQGGAEFQRNANSCLSCHNVPMPGGSGMSKQSLVQIDNRKQPGSREETIQTGFPAAETTLAPDTQAETRKSPSLFGIGYLQYADRDGGQSAHGVLGAFGKEPDFRTFVATAFATELGVSSRVRCARRRDEPSYPIKCAPIISDDELYDVGQYILFLAAPPHHPQSAQTLGGKLFDTLGCASCHVPAGITRSDAPEPLRSRRFEAYTDLALHDMGSRAPVVTAPLWGLGSVGPPYMHDACGVSLAGAIACHRGEGAGAAAKFKDLPAAEQEDLVAYLKSL